MKLKAGRFMLDLRPKRSESKTLAGEPFLARYVVARTPWFDIIVRNLVGPNYSASPPHSHGVEMFTLCLKGGYDDTLHDNVKGTVRHRKVRFGTITHLRLTDFHTTDAIHGKTGAWTLGFDARWRGLESASFLLDDGEVIPMIEFARRQSIRPDFLDEMKKMTREEHVRQAGAGT